MKFFLTALTDSNDFWVCLDKRIYSSRERPKKVWINFVKSDVNRKHRIQIRRILETNEKHFHAVKIHTVVKREKVANKQTFPL